MWSYGLTGDPTSACGGQRTTTDSNHQKLNTTSANQPMDTETTAHTGQMNILTEITTRGINVGRYAIRRRPRSRPKRDRHWGHSHSGEIPNQSRFQPTGWPQLGHFLLPNLGNGGLNKAIAPPPGISTLYHVRRNRPLSVTRSHPSAYEAAAEPSAGRRTTTESNHHRANNTHAPQPAKNDISAHPGHLWTSPSIRTRVIGRPTAIAWSALRPRSMPRTKPHFGQFHSDHGTFINGESHHFPGWPQLGHCLFARLYNGGLNKGMAPPPRICTLYHACRNRPTLTPQWR